MNLQQAFQNRATQRKKQKFENVKPIQLMTGVEAQNEVAPQQEESLESAFKTFAARKKENKKKSFGILDTTWDAVKQVGKGLASGIGGAYGNVLDTLGLQAPAGAELPESKKQVANAQTELLDKIKSGQPLSAGESRLLSYEDESPGYARLPTSKEINTGIENLTGLGEGETAIGRILGRGAEFAGEGLATGGGRKVLSVLAGAGVTGQGIRETGAPEALASTVEIGGPLLHGAFGGKLNPRNFDDARFVKAGRNLGFSERELTPLIQSNAKVATLKPIARKGTKTQKLFEDISARAGDTYDQIKKLPGSDKQIPINTKAKLHIAFNDLKHSLSNTLQASPDKQGAINFIDEAIKELSSNGATPNKLINFWQDINSAANWNAIRGGKKQLAALKKPISDALESVSPEISKTFSDINELYSRFKGISKKLKPDLVDSFINKGELFSAGPAAFSLIYGNPYPLLGVGGATSTRLLAREMLINPYFQNLGNKLVTNINAASVKGATDLVKQAQDYMTRKYPKQDWSFLTKPQIED